MGVSILIAFPKFGTYQNQFDSVSRVSVFKKVRGFNLRRSLFHKSWKSRLEFFSTKGFRPKPEALYFESRNWLRGLGLNQRPSGYELEGQTLSLDDSIAFTVHRPPNTIVSICSFGR